jgi:soluble lytic murein transglycosylase-like protein
MDDVEVPLRTDHPPDAGRKRKIGCFVGRLTIKTTLALLVFILILCFPISYPLPEIPARQQIIQEIAAFLEKQETDFAPVTPHALAETIYDEAVRYKHDPKLILALIGIESAFRNSSVSDRGAKGLMQIMPYVAEAVAQDLKIEWRGDQTLFNPLLNIKLGIYYLKMLMDDFQDLGVALTAYNYGPTYIKSLLGKGEKIPLHHFRYYQRVLAFYRNL